MVKYFEKYTQTTEKKKLLNHNFICKIFPRSPERLEKYSEYHWFTIWRGKKQQIELYFKFL